MKTLQSAYFNFKGPDENCEFHFCDTNITYELKT